MANVLGYDHLARSRQINKPCGDVHGVADRGVLHALRGTNIADHGATRVQTHANSDRRQASLEGGVRLGGRLRAAYQWLPSRLAAAVGESHLEPVCDKHRDKAEPVLSNIFVQFWQHARDGESRPGWIGHRSILSKFEERESGRRPPGPDRRTA